MRDVSQVQLFCGCVAGTNHLSNQGQIIRGEVYREKVLSHGTISCLGGMDFPREFPYVRKFRFHTSFPRKNEVWEGKNYTYGKSLPNMASYRMKMRRRNKEILHTETHLQKIILNNFLNKIRIQRMIFCFVCCD